MQVGPTSGMQRTLDMYRGICGSRGLCRYAGWCCVVGVVAEYLYIIYCLTLVYPHAPPFFSLLLPSLPLKVPLRDHRARVLWGSLRPHARPEPSHRLCHRCHRSYHLAITIILIISIVVAHLLLCLCFPQWNAAHRRAPLTIPWGTGDPRRGRVRRGGRVLLSGG